MKLNLSASMEDYVEAICRIVEEKKAVRAKDIADRLKVKRPSVSGALQNLAHEGLVNYTPYGVITLTEAGEAVAHDIIGRHMALKRFFIEVLDVDEAEAERAACGMEHAVSNRIIAKLVNFMNKRK